MMVRVGNFLFRYRNAIFPLACALLFLPGPALFDHPLIAAAVGGAIACIGQLVRVATIGLRYIVRGGRGGRVYADDLITEGIYTLCRNPMYVGNVLLVTGIAIASNSLTTLLCALPLVLFVYSAIVAAEEKYLREKFGPAFAEYCRQVPKWLPRAAAMRQAFQSASFNWRRVVLKEYGTPFGWANVLCGIALYRLWQQDALQSDSRVTQVLVAVMVLATLLWATARLFKKTGWLAAD